MYTREGTGINLAGAVSYTYTKALPKQSVSFYVQAFYKDGSDIVISKNSSTKTAKTVLASPVMKSAAATKQQNVKVFLVKGSRSHRI
ncbi:MAG: hypothetical protein V8R80_07815 [Eubacterium sp.]